MTLTLLRHLASQSLEYVLPSAPHTGLYSRVQAAPSGHNPRFGDLGKHASDEVKKRKIRKYFMLKLIDLGNNLELTSLVL